MIEIEAKCNRFEVARIAWAAGDGFKPGQEMEFVAGYPGVECPTHRVTIATGGQPISALRLHFPGGEGAPRIQAVGAVEGQVLEQHAVKADLDHRPVNRLRGPHQLHIDLDREGFVPRHVQARVRDRAFAADGHFPFNPVFCKGMSDTSMIEPIGIS